MQKMIKINRRKKKIFLNGFFDFDNLFLLLDGILFCAYS